MSILDVHESESERATEDKKRKGCQRAPVFPEEEMDLTSDLARPLAGCVSVEQTQATPFHLEILFCIFLA